MASRTVSLEASAYDRLKSAKRPGESFSETVNRILAPTRPTFRSIAGILAPADGLKVRKAIYQMRRLEEKAERARLTKIGGPRRGRHT